MSTKQTFFLTLTPKTKALSVATVSHNSQTGQAARSDR